MLGVFNGSEVDGQTFRVKMGSFLLTSFVEEVSNAGSPEHLPHAHTCINKLVLHRCSDQSRRMLERHRDSWQLVHMWFTCGFSVDQWTRYSSKGQLREKLLHALPTEGFQFA